MPANENNRRRGTGTVVRKTQRTPQKSSQRNNNTPPVSPSVMKALAVAFGVTTVAVIIIMIVYFSKRLNGTEIYISGSTVPLGVVKGITITAEDIHEKALVKLKSDEGEVIVNETLTAKRVHAKSKNFVTEAYIIGEVYKKFTYRVLASVINVDGKQSVVLKNAGEAESVMKEIKETYFLEDASVYFLENITVEDIYVEKSGIKTTEKAKAVLTEEKREEVTYNVRQGDSLWGIAQKHEMSLDDIYMLNPDLNQDPSKLKLGASLVISRSVPFVSVVTVRRETYEERNDAGDNGTTVAEITRINGEETERKRISWFIIE